MRDSEMEREEMEQTLASAVPDLQQLFGLQADTQLADGAARFEAINPFVSCIVQAPAGSGKTALLTQRFLALLTQVDQPEKIVAMTFTKKAAAEMRERVIGALKLGLRAELPENASLFERNTWKLAQRVMQRDRDQAWSLLENPNRLRIKTIDGINGFLVAQMPLLSRMGAQPRMTERADEHYRQAARLTLKEPAAAGAVASLLRLVNGRYHRAEGLLVNMLKKRDQWMGSLLSMRGEAAREALEQALQWVVQLQMHHHVGALQGVRDLLKEACSLADFAVHNDQAWLQPLCGWTLEDSVDALPQWRVLADWLLTKDSKSVRKSVTKNNGFPPGKGEAQENKARFQNVLAGLRDAPQAEAVLEAMVGLKGLPDPHYSEDQWDDLQGLIELLTLCAGYLKVVFQTHAEADFIEVAQAASQALGSELEPTDLAQQLDYQIHHLLVDEFQDTSSEQYALLNKLVAGWQAGDGRTLFVVGDPMQSIYRFRQAEVGNFLKAWQGRIGEVRLQPLSLVVNFRSSKAVVEWVNQTFARVFPRRDNMESGAVRFSPAQANSSDDAPAVHCHWHLNQSPEEEAVEVVQLIKTQLAQWREGGGSADTAGEAPKIALLGRSRSSLMRIASLLKQQGIGFRAVELEALQARQEIQDCLALSRALLHLADRPAWIALLRSPLVGLSLNDLHALLGQEFSTPVWRQIQSSQWPQSGLSAEGRQRLEEALPILQAALKRLGSLPFSVLARECWLQLDGPQTVENDTALENVAVYWCTLGGADHQTLDTEKLETLMSALYASPDAAPHSQQVELMTMHKSKGLEFDTVILPGLGRQARANDKELVSWLQFMGPHAGFDVNDPDAPAREWLVIAPLDQKGQGESLLSGLLKRFEQQKQDYELARLLYVAATRAKRQLHLFGSVTYKPSDKEDSAPAPSKGALLEPLWPCVGRVFSEMAMAYEEGDALLPAADYAPKVPRLPLQRPSMAEQLREARERSRPLTSAHPPLAQTEFSVRLETAPLAPVADSETQRMSGSAQALLNTGVGNLVHEVLQQVGEEGIAHWSVARVRALQPFYRYLLQSQGLQGAALEEAVRRVLRCLENALRHEQVRWALETHHLQAQCEYPLSALEAESGAIRNVIVDRTFVDADGVRWIVDYKTSVCEGDVSAQQAMVDQLAAQYHDQLQRYGTLLEVMDQQRAQNGEQPAVSQQRWVLYFCYLDRWVELACAPR